MDPVHLKIAIGVAVVILIVVVAYFLTRRPKATPCPVCADCPKATPCPVCADCPKPTPCPVCSVVLPSDVLPKVGNIIRLKFDGGYVSKNGSLVQSAGDAATFLVGDDASIKAAIVDSTVKSAVTLTNIVAGGSAMNTVLTTNGQYSMLVIAAGYGLYDNKTNIQGSNLNTNYVPSNEADINTALTNYPVFRVSVEVLPISQ